MSAGPPLPVDLWDSLSPEARALILTLQAEAAELRAKVRALQQQVHDLQERLNQTLPTPPDRLPPTCPRSSAAHRAKAANSSAGNWGTAAFSSCKLTITSGATK